MRKQVLYCIRGEAVGNGYRDGKRLSIMIAISMLRRLMESGCSSGKATETTESLLESRILLIDSQGPTIKDVYVGHYSKSW